MEDHPSPCPAIELQNFSVSLISSKNVAKKHLIQPISLAVAPGSLFAIMGGSGCGKTTLINALSNKYDKKAIEVSGVLRFSNLIDTAALVTQSDHLIEHLTVKETLLFKAKLIKNQPEHDIKHSDSMVESVMRDLGLSSCADRLVGSNGSLGEKTSLSGGERRRVSIALQLLWDPKVLFLDEPTSGLDAFRALSVMEYLKNISLNKQTTVICTIHQPRADILSLIDKLLLLTKGGRTVYCGDRKSMMTYFENLGFPCPNGVNPADYYVDLISYDMDITVSAAQKMKTKERIEKLVCEFQQTQDDPAVSVSTDFSSKSLTEEQSNAKFRSSSIGTQLSMLIWRSFMINRRNSIFFLTSVSRSMLASLIFACVYWQLDESLSAIRSRPALFYIAASVESYSLITGLVDFYYKFLPILDRESDEGLYHPLLFLVAMTVAQTPQFICQVIGYAIPMYFATNLRLGGIQFFFQFISVLFVLIYNANGIAWLACSISRTYSVSMVLISLMHLFLSTGCGFLVNIDSLPVYISWVKDISYISYAWRLLLINEFGDRTLGNNCDSADSNCVHGNEFLNSLGFHPNEYNKFWCILLGSMAFYYFLAIFLLSTNRFPPYSSAVSSTSSTEEETSIETEDEKSDSSEIPHVSTLKEHRQVSKSTNRSTTYSAVTNVEDEVLFENIYETLEMDELNPRSPPNPLSRSPSTRLSIVTELKETVSTPDYVPRIKEGIVLELINVSLSAGGTSLNKVQTKPILNNINLRLEPGNLIALMGASGSGKSTLMNLVADRIPHKTLNRNQNQSQSQSPAFFSKTGLTGSGEILFNGKAPSSSDVRNLVSYVLQFDFHMPNLTVKETLDFHVKLRFPMETPPPFLVDRLNVVMKLLGLSSCASVLVGNDEVKGISGGEKRRLSIAIQLLSDPVLCLLDEPTTGLDSFTARHIVQTLKALTCLDEEDLLDFAENQNSFSPTKRLKSPLSMSFSHSFLSSQSKSIQKKTVLISIHQARYDIFEHIDQIILLAKGNIIWSGDIEGMLNHFNQLGFPCPSNVNPADFIVDLTSEVITESSLGESKSILDILISGYVAVNAREPSEDEKGDIESNHNNTSTIIIKDASKRSLLSMNDDLLSPAEANNEIEEFSTLKPDWFTIPLLVKRNFQNLWRQKSLFFARCKHPLFFSIVLCLFFAPLMKDQASIQNRFGILYDITTLTIFFGVLMGLEIFRTETLLFRREYVDGIYSPTAFLISYFIIAIPLILLGASIFAFAASYLIGLAPTGIGFIHFTIISFCCIFAGECLSVFVCSTFADLRDSVNIMNFILSIFGVTMGTFAISMPIFFNYYRYFSPLHWSMYLLASFTFHDEKFSCDGTTTSTSTNQCFFTDGNDIFEFYFGHYDEESFLFHYWMLIVVTMSYFILAVISFRLSALNLSH